MLNLKLKPCSSRPSREELEEQIETLKLDNSLLSEELQYVKYMLTHPPKYIKGDVVSDRYLILEFKPWKEHFINARVENVLFGGAIALGLDFLFDRKGFRLTEKYFDHLKNSVQTKPSWKYKVYDKKLMVIRTMSEQEMVTGII